jgi:hypothetical protein
MEASAPAAKPCSFGSVRFIQKKELGRDAKGTGMEQEENTGMHAFSVNQVTVDIKPGASRP